MDKPASPKPTPAKRRIARPLLVASAAITIGAVAAGCPFGNLKAPDCDQGQCDPPDMSMPFGNLKGPDMGPPDLKQDHD
jgi:hypothetical protein